MKVLQFGQGNFLRTFADVYFETLNQEGLDYQVYVATAIPHENLEAFRRQGNRYHVVLRGSQGGQPVEQVLPVTCLQEVIDPFLEPEAFYALAEDPELKLIVSNTTEAGIQFHSQDSFEGFADITFPAKVTKFLYRRFQAGQPGIYLLPVELIDNNAGELARCVEEYITLWGLPQEFRQWNQRENFYCNTLVDRIVSYKMTIGMVYTNGWLLNENVLNEFERRGLRPEIEISFDGVGWHDWMRGVPGAEKSVLRTLELCHDRGFDISVGMCIHRGNQSSLPQTVKILGEAGVKDIKTAAVDDTSLWRRHHEGNAMTQGEYIEAMLPYISWYYESGRPIECLELGGVARLLRDAPAEVCVRHYDGTEKCVDCYLCGAVRWSCYITPEGRLLPCMPMTACPEQNWFPKVQEIGLREGLSGSFYMKFTDSRIKDLMKVNAECAACSYRYECGGGCRAVALMEGEHDLMGCDRSMCMLWKNGYVDRIRRTVQEINEKYWNV